MDAATAFGLTLAAAGVIATAVFGWLQLKKPRMATKISATNIVGRDQNLFNSLTITPAPVPTERRRTPKPPKATTPVFDETLVDELVEVDAGTIEGVPVFLEEGSVIRGTAKEIDGFDFDFFIFSEAKYARFCDGEDVTPLVHRENVSSVPIRFRAPRTGRYVVAFQVYGKQYTREIELELWRVRGG